jgi:ubiquinone/menaquinone biosynthesis C-methylase UbiE
VTDPVAAGYDAVYASWTSSPTFHELWARHAVDGDIADGFEHLNFASVSELERMRTALDLPGGGRIVDLACGAGGPGAWMARATRAVLVGIDLSSVGARLAAARARRHGLSHAAFTVGSVDALPFADAGAAGAMSLDSLQYVPDKRTTFAEVARVLRRNGRFVFTAFEVDPERVRDVPVLGVHPVPDYSVVLRDVGFRVETYEETPNWNDRLVAAYSAVVDAAAILRGELGDDAMDSLLLEMTLTLEIQPYVRRVFVSATNDRR